jgi:hypothetical protein
MNRFENMAGPIFGDTGYRYRWTFPFGAPKGSSILDTEVTAQCNEEVVEQIYRQMWIKIMDAVIIPVYAL